MPECRYCKKNFITNKALEMHIFQVHERRGTKVDKINVDWEKTKQHYVYTLISFKKSRKIRIKRNGQYWGIYTRESQIPTGALIC